MNLLIISTMAGYSWGGSEELWLRVARFFVQKGHHVAVSIYKWDTESDKIKLLENEGVVVFRQRRKKYRFMERLFRKGVQDFRRSMKRIESFGPHVTLVSQGTSFEIIQSDFYCDLIRHLDSPFFLLTQHAREQVLIKNRPKALEIARQASGFFFVAHRNLAAIERGLAYRFSNACIVDNPVTFPVPDAIPFPGDTPLNMAVVARMDCKDKGQDILLDVLSQSKWRKRSWHLTFYGSGPDEGYLKSLMTFYELSENVSFAGHVRSVQDIWKKNALLVLPSLAEGQPLSLIEAMLSRRCAVATDVGGMAELIRDGINGFLAAAPTVELLDDALERMWHRRRDLIEMGVSAYEDIRAKLDFQPEEKIYQVLMTSIQTPAGSQQATL